MHFLVLFFFFFCISSGPLFFHQFCSCVCVCVKTKKQPSAPPPSLFRRRYLLPEGIATHRASPRSFARTASSPASAKQKATRYSM